MKRLLPFLSLAVALVLSVSCGKEPDQPVEENVSFEIEVPASLKTYAGAEVVFRFTEGKGPKTTDALLFKSGSTEIQCMIKDVRATEFSFIIPDAMKSASYFVWIDRNGMQKKVGTVSVTIVDQSQIPDVDYNLFGKVSAGGQPVADVVVSDGYLTVKTDSEGMYYLQSQKKRGYVFISVPSGYEAASDGILPRFHKSIKRDEYEIEQADFQLTKVEGQENHMMYVLGDMHLAGRNDDLKQFDVFAADLNSQLSANSGRRQYALTLGDMTWEIYWSQFSFSNYVREMNAKFSDLQVFHTIGNHDHDVNAEGDFNTVLEYFSYIGPNYYSFNIGSVHYVVLDDILCKNSGAGTSESRDYATAVDADQIAWLKKDLAYVDPDMTVVAASHAPLYYPSNSSSFKASLDGASELISCFSKFSNVHFFTGHTHDIYNVDKMSSANPHFEHNAGAVCATWWWTWKTCGMNLARDGAPGGYTICDFDGKNFEWIYKGYDRSIDYQFRAYDMNKVDSSEFPKGYDTYAGTSANSVLINIWNWDPEWKLSVTEGGKELSWQQIYDYDPLHVLGYTKVRGTNTTSSFLSKKTPHLFMVQASSPDTTLEIKVTDRFGNVYKESMKRPRDFKIESYNN